MPWHSNRSKVIDGIFASVAQTIRAILLASATATTLRGLRDSNPNN